MQHANDSPNYRSCKINQKDTCIKELEKDITSIVKWLIETNLVFSTGKTKFMLLTTKQMSVWQKIKSKINNLRFAAMASN